MPRRYYSSTAARTTLSSSCNNSDTTLSVTAVSGWPSSFPYTLIIDQDTINEEVVNVTARTGTSLTVERGQDGTTAVSHSAGASVNHGVSARDFNEPNQFLNEGGTVAGPTLVTANSASNALEVRQTGAGNALVVEDSTNPDSTPFVVDASGNVGIGTSTPSERLTVAGDILISDATPILKFVDTDNNADAQIDGGNGNLTFRADANDEAGSSSMVWTIDGTERMRITSAGNVGIGTSNVAYTLDVVGSTGARVGRFAGAPVVAITRAEGSSASPTIVTNGSTVGGVYFQGYDGSAYRSTAAVLSDVDGTPGASDMPGRLTFLTTADGAATLSERMRITSAGNVGIGTSSPGANLHMAANGSNALRIERADDSAASPIIAFWKERGTLSAPTIVNSNDSIGDLLFSGHDGSTLRIAARIRAAVDGAPAASDMPGRLQFYTTADGGVTENERMRIDNAGLITGTGTSLGAWTAYTPTVSSGTGTITSYTSSGYYTRIGKIVHAVAYVTITNNGTGASYVNVDVPLAIRNVTPAPVGQGREDGITGNGLQWRGIVGTGVARAYTYNNTYPGANNAVLLLSITYETSA